MRKNLIQTIKIPEGTEANIVGKEIVVKGKEGEIKKKFNSEKITFEKKDDSIIMKSEKATKREKKLMNTLRTHLKNMLEGVQNKFEYKLKICNSHFPMKVEIENGKAVVKNFLGEKIPRVAKILQGAEAKMDGDIITVTSIDKEIAGQTAANFEKATWVKARDRRVFQDGIFITNKSGREI